MSLSLTKKICDALVEKKLISGTDLEKAAKIRSEKGGVLSDILVNMNAISKFDLLTSVSEEFGFPPIKMSRMKIDKDTLGIIPKKVALEYRVLPVSRIANQLTVAMVDPLNVMAFDDLKTITNLKISPLIADEDDMNEAIQKYHETSADDAISAIVDDIETADMEMISAEEADISSGELFRITEEAPVVKLTDLILSKGVKSRASDILIEPMENGSRVRYRIDGILYQHFNPPGKYHRALISRIKVMSDLDIAERRLPQDGRFRLKIQGRKIDFRVSIVPSVLGEKACLRILDKDQGLINLKSLGFKDRDREKMQEVSERPHGMILICGPTGSGKTTTLYSILKHINDPAKNIVTVEDPVEYEMKGANQVSINTDIGLTFARCLRSILRQDPDIIMVGEIRDFETLDIAIKSALTGHLVLSTLHTNSAAGSIIRMINMGVEPFLIAASIELIVAQRLLRKLCLECREPYIPTDETAEKYGLYDEKGKAKQIYKPVGCKRCLNSGYLGRVGIVESMKFTPNIKELISNNVHELELERAARKEGMVSLRDNGIEAVLQGLASLENVLSTTIGNRDTE